MMSLLFRTNTGKRTAITSKTWQQIYFKSRFKTIYNACFGYTLRFFHDENNRFVDIVSSENDMQIKYWNDELEMLDALRLCGATL